MRDPITFSCLTDVELQVFIGAGEALRQKGSPGCLPPLDCPLLPTGGRTGEAIVDAALSALRQLVKDRLAGRSGGYSSGKQVRLCGPVLVCLGLQLECVCSLQRMSHNLG